MMKHEFEQIAGIKVTNEDYKEIEFVYTWHPAIPDVNGKQVIANIYNAGGMMIIKDMKATAQKWFERNMELTEIQKQILELQKQKDEVIDKYNRYLSNR